MVVYSILLIWIILCSQLEDTNLTWGRHHIISGKGLYLLITFFPIWFIMAFRGITVGTDTFANSSYFVSATMAPSFSYIIDNGIWNAGINVISYVIGVFFSGAEAYVFWSSTVIAVSFAAFIYRTSNRVWVSTFLFLTLNLFFSSLNTSRQFIAIGIALNAFVYLYYNMCSGKGWALFLLASWIHTATISFVPSLVGIWLAKRYQSYTKLYSLSICLSILFVIAMMSIATIFSSFFPHYAIYTEGGSQDNLFENTGGGKIVVVYVIFLVMLGFLFVKKQIQRSKVMGTMVDAFIPGAIFCVIVGIAFSTNTMMNRVALPYQCFFLSLIPFVIAMMKKNTQYIFMAIMLCGLVGYYYLWMQGNLGNIIPYYTWL